MMQSLSSGAGCARAAPQPAAVRRARLLPRASATAEPPAAVEPAAAATDAAADADARPGVLDAEAFSCSPSVEEWRDWRFPSEGSSDVQSLGQELAAAASDVQAEPSSAPLLAYGVARATFFATQALFSLAASGVTSGTQDSSPLGKIQSDTYARLFTETIKVFRQDTANVRAGLYKAPWDAEPLNSSGDLHRQWNPLYVARQSARFVREAAGTLQRRNDRASTSVWLESDDDMYPRYYRHTFHYQSDGWFSTESANVPRVSVHMSIHSAKLVGHNPDLMLKYETSTETLFLGRQDAMQRQTLIPLGRHLRSGGQVGEGARILEIAAGTGRFATFVRDNFPAAEMVVSDLSPYYLEKARENLAYWESQRGADAAKECSGGKLGKLRLLQANAEAVPEKDASYDAVLSVYLFHELPAEARRTVVREAARLLKPGGIFVLTDSIQKGDRPVQDPYLYKFGAFAEPHYPGYTEDSFTAIAREAGLVPWEKEQCSASKTLSFRKPMDADEAA